MEIVYKDADNELHYAGYYTEITTADSTNLKLTHRIANVRKNYYHAQPDKVSYLTDISITNVDMITILGGGVNNLFSLNLSIIDECIRDISLVICPALEQIGIDHDIELFHDKIPNKVIVIIKLLDYMKPITVQPYEFIRIISNTCYFY